MIASGYVTESQILEEINMAQREAEKNRYDFISLEEAEIEEASLFNDQESNDIQDVTVVSNLEKQKAA